MRTLVEPSPAMRCEHCEGELLFKCIEPDNPAFDTEVQLYVCAKCGRTYSRQIVHDPYAAHVARAISQAAVARPSDSERK